MSKFTLFTFDANRQNLLKELQKIESVHFKNLQSAESEELNHLNKVTSAIELSHAETELGKVSFTLSKIEPYYEKPKGFKAMSAPPPELSFEDFDTFTNTYDYNSVYNTVKENDERAKLLKSEKNKIKTDSDALSLWLSMDVSTKELDGLKNAKYLTGTIPRLNSEQFSESVTHDFPNTYIELLDSVKDEISVLVITTPESFEGVSNILKSHSFTKVNLTLEKPARETVSDNNAKISEIEAKEAKNEEEIKVQSTHYQNLKITYDYLKTLSERHRTCENFMKTKDVCIAEGWTPEGETQNLINAVEKVCGKDYYIETEPVEKDSQDVPIKLKNNKFVTVFEGITEMYSMPKYNEIDPTPLLTPFYILFFAIMLGDAGYGLVLTLGTAFALKFMNLKKSSRRFFTFFLYLGIAAIVVGTVFGSAFGVTFFAPLKNANGSPKPILDLQNEIMLMLILSVAIGVVQILAGLSIKGYMLIRDGKILDAIFDSLFWILAVGSLIAVLVFAATGADAVFTNVSGIVLAASLVGLGATQGRSSPSIGGKIGNGIYSVYNITGYVGDFVSYTRLMAIALSGAYIAFSFNLMGGLLVQGENPNPLLYIPAAAICIFGAALDLGLGALGAYVHSCRLQYVEYFGKFYEGGGVPFKPLELKNTFINIKK
ncbi:MAG: V-type ATP synthase subunit I [Clostridiales bacterium]|nr:V-type ATP synthase subunit I [Clostridiales bacterium]